MEEDFCCALCGWTCADDYSDEDEDEPINDEHYHESPVFPCPDWLLDFRGIGADPDQKYVDR